MLFLAQMNVRTYALSITSEALQNRGIVPCRRSQKPIQTRFQAVFSEGTN